MAPELPFRRALSIGCGTGPLERPIVSLGIASHVTAVDESANAVGFAKSAATEAGMGGKINYLVWDGRQVLRETSGWDAIFFHESLHHFDRLEELFALIRAALRPGGILFLDEYIGPSRDEWSWRKLLFPNLVYRCLPRDLRRTKIIRAPVTEDDPTEMICSSQIGPLVRRKFDILEWKNYGGNLMSLIYVSLKQPAISDLSARKRFDDAVEFLLDLEDFLLDHPILTLSKSFHAAVIARNRVGGDSEAGQSA